MRTVRRGERIACSADLCATLHKKPLRVDHIATVSVWDQFMLYTRMAADFNRIYGITFVHFSFSVSYLHVNCAFSASSSR